MKILMILTTELKISDLEKGRLEPARHAQWNT